MSPELTFLVFVFLPVVLLSVVLFRRGRTVRPLVTGPVSEPAGDLVQVQLVGADGRWKVAQHRFENGTGPGSKLAWMSEMIAQSELSQPVQASIYRQDEEEFIRVNDDNFNPIYLPR